MSRFRRKPAAGVRMDAPKIMRVRYRGWCRCGTSIAIGDIIWIRGAFCQPCGRKTQQSLTTGISEVFSVPDLQQVIDRLRQIQSLPRKPVPEELGRNSAI